MALEYSFVLPGNGFAENHIVKEMFDDIKLYVDALAPSGTTAPANAQYITLATNADLTNERVLTAGAGISLTDNGAGSTLVVANTGVRSLEGTLDQIYVNGTSGSAQTGVIVLTLPQNIDTDSDPVFNTVTGTLGVIGSNLISTTVGSISTPSVQIFDSNTGFYREFDQLILAVQGVILSSWDSVTQIFRTNTTKTASLVLENLAGSHPTVTINPPSGFTSYTLTLPTDDGTSNQVLTTDGSGVLSWSTPAGSGANTALSNLASVAINTSLISDTANTDDLGSTSIPWRTGYFQTSLQLSETAANTPRVLIVSYDQDNTGTHNTGGIEIRNVDQSSAGRGYRLSVDGDGVFKLVDLGNTPFTGTTNLFSVTPSGEVTQPLQPSFLVTDGTGATDVTGDGTVYTELWPTEVYDQGGDFASNTFTAPVTGRYLLSAKVRLLNILVGATTRDITIVTSNRNYSNTINQALAQPALTLNHAVIADMDANDTATVTLSVTNQTKTVDVNASDIYNNFSGSLIN